MDGWMVTCTYHSNPSSNPRGGGVVAAYYGRSKNKSTIRYTLCAMINT